MLRDPLATCQFSDIKRNCLIVMGFNDDSKCVDQATLVYVLHAVMYVMQLVVFQGCPSFLFALMHATYKYMSEPAGEKNGVKQDIKIKLK